MRTHLRRVWISYRDIWFLHMVLLCAGLILLIYQEKGDTILQLQGIKSVGADVFFHTITELGGGWSYVVMAILFVFVSFRISAFIALLGLLLLPVIGSLKYLFGFPRPILFFEWMGVAEDYPVFSEGHLDPLFTSFPSGHTTAAFALATLLIFVVRKSFWRYFIWVLAAVVGLSRMYLAFHFLEDVLMGAVLGTALAVLAFYALRRSRVKWRFLDRNLGDFFSSQKGVTKTGI